jgi:CBS domain-containing protein
MDLAEAAARVPLGEIMRRDVVAIRRDVALDSVIRLLADGSAGCVAVVDERGGVMGIVSKTDLVVEQCDGGADVAKAPRLRRGFHVVPAQEATAADVMRRGVHCLPEDARLSHAIGIMATERIAHLPVVDATGGLAEMLESDDVVAWLARQFGYTDVGRPHKGGL